MQSQVVSHKFPFWHSASCLVSTANQAFKKKKKRNSSRFFRSDKPFLMVYHHQLSPVTVEYIFTRNEEVLKKTTYSPQNSIVSLGYVIRGILTQMGFQLIQRLIQFNV